MTTTFYCSQCIHWKQNNCKIGYQTTPETHNYRQGIKRKTKNKHSIHPTSPTAKPNTFRGAQTTLASATKPQKRQKTDPLTELQNMLGLGIEEVEHNE